VRPTLSFVFSFLLTAVITGQNLNYYFGNLHAHTAFSDGNKDSASSGVSKPSGSYAYAKLSADFDFLGISEHNHYSSFRNPGFKKHLYQEGLSQSDAANAEGSFLALYGMEYGVSSEYNGHVIIYGFSQLIGWETSAPGVTGNNYDVFNGKTDYDGLFRKVKAQPGAFCYLAHPQFNDFSTDGTWLTSLANAPYNATYDSVIVGMPLRSGLAASTASNYGDYSTGNYFNYYKKMLYNGYHLGIGYDHDNHYTNFGRSNGGRLVIMAPVLTRSALFNAMKSRNFYGSDDANAQLAFTLNGKIMGTIVKGDGYPVLAVSHTDPDGEPADTIKIWKGWKNSGGLWATIVHTSLQSNSSLFTDQYITPGTEYFYFTELRQADGHWMVSSPVWYTAGSVTGINESGGALFTMCHDAVRHTLSISFVESGVHHLILRDLRGRVLRSVRLHGSDSNIDLAEFSAGIYLVEIQNGGKREVKRLLLH
jgi:hypothetical protein